MTCTFYSSAQWHSGLHCCLRARRSQNQFLAGLGPFLCEVCRFSGTHSLKHQVKSPVSALDQGSGVGRCTRSGIGQMQRANFIILLAKCKDPSRNFCFRGLQETFMRFEFSTAHRSIIENMTQLCGLLRILDSYNKWLWDISRAYRTFFPWRATTVS